MEAEKKKAEEVTVSAKLPTPLHTKLTAIAQAEGKTLAQKLAQAAREHAAGYERTSRTVTEQKTATSYKRKKRTP